MIQAQKVQAAGNDFILIPVDEKHPQNSIYENKTVRQSIVERLCNRNFGIGADGLVFVFLNKNIYGEQTCEFSWDFYNQDGSSAQMCGNAARAVVKYAVEKLSAKKSSCFYSLAGKISYQYNEDQICIGVESIKELLAPSQLVMEEKTFSYMILNTGVPHAVVEVEDFDNVLQMHHLVKQLRYPSSLDSAGANVSFFKQINENSIRSISFERGLENFSLACGTGAIATSYVFCKKQNIYSCVAKMPGGNVKLEFDKNYSSAKLIGEAQLVFECQFLHKDFI